jgi:uncharacterized protein YkwD
MGSMNFPRWGLVVAVVSVLGLGTLGAGAAAAAAKPPRTELLGQINAVRVAHGLRAVAPARLLHGVALGHSDDMILRDYFGHTSPSGWTLKDRLMHSGFVRGYIWMAGETLAWGLGPTATPLATVQAWLHSPEHRAILLSPSWRQVGISRACGHFLGHVGACVWTADWVARW